MSNLKIKTLNVPKILIACPTASIKDYCLDDFLQNVNSFTYPANRRDLFMCDNSKDNSYYKYLIKKGIKAEYVKFKNRGIIQRMAESHNRCREYALRFGFDFMLHLECDVFPPVDIIERLLMHRKDIVAAMYPSFGGKLRRIIAIAKEPTDAEWFVNTFYLTEVDSETTYFDGTLRPVFHAGMGCVLMSRHVLKQIPFRQDPQVDYHPDTNFAVDAYKQGFQYYLDTGIFCEHRNQSWGKYGWNYQ